MGTFRADYTGIGRLLVSEGMVAEMDRRAHRVKEAAEMDAPYDERDRDGDHYRDHFSVSSGIQERKTRRAVGTVTNDTVSKTTSRLDVSVAFLVEFGSKNNPAHHTLTRALDAAKG